MKNWICVTEKGFILASGIEGKEGALMTYRADIGLVRIPLKTAQDAMNIAPTSYKILYPKNMNT